MTPEDARTEAVALIESAQRTIGGEWRKADIGSQECTLPSGDKGITHAATRLGRPIPKDEQESILDRITSDWTDAGFPPARIELPVFRGITVTQLRFPEHGRDEGDVFLELQVATTASSVDTRSGCVPGSAADINRRDASDSW